MLAGSRSRTRSASCTPSDRRSLRPRETPRGKKSQGRERGLGASHRIGARCRAATLAARHRCYLGSGDAILISPTAQVLAFILHFLTGWSPFQQIDSWPSAGPAVDRTHAILCNGHTAMARIRLSPYPMISCRPLINPFRASGQCVNPFAHPLHGRPANLADLDPRRLGKRTDSSSSITGKSARCT